MKYKRHVCIVFLFIFISLIMVSPPPINGAISTKSYSGSSTTGLYNIYAKGTSSSDTFGPTNYSTTIAKNITTAELTNVTFHASKIDVQVSDDDQCLIFLLANRAC